MSNLSRGSAGDDVQRLQTELNRVGYAVNVTGLFDLATDAAVFAFQRDANLKRDGIVGPNTKTQLAAAPTKGAAVPPVARYLKHVRWFSQRDNKNRPDRTCNVTCVAMVMDSLGVTSANGGQLEDELFAELDGDVGRAYFAMNFPTLVAQYHPWNVHGMLTWLFIRRGLHATFSMTASWGSVWAQIDRGHPVIVSGSLTGAGHIVLLVGETVAGDLIVHDPWGDWNRGYPKVAGQLPDGAARVYPYERINPVLSQSLTAKWAHFVPAPTGSG